MAANSVLAQIDGLVAAGDVAEAENLLQTAGTNDPAITFAHALRLLTGDGLPRDIVRARELLCSAEERGNADAALFEMAMRANGFGGKPNWRSARRMLERWSASERVAAIQASLIASMDLDRNGMPRTLPAAIQVAEKPAIYRVNAFATAAECAHLARSVIDILAPSVVFDPISGEQRQHPIRRSSGAVVGPTREDLVVNALARRIAAVTDTNWQAAEPFQVLHYTCGQEYRLHHDMVSGDPNPRVCTAILYLNDNFCGGETFFPAGNFAAKPKAGDLLFFRNLDAYGQPDPDAMHAGLPLQAGVKWIATRWIRQSPPILTEVSAG